MKQNFRLPIRVYYEDTDAGGVVYYANYLRYFERARTECLRSLGVGQADLMVEAKLAFAVRSLTTEFVKPARLDDALEVVSSIAELGRAQVVFDQQVERQGEALVTARVRVACLDLERGKATAIPSALHQQLKRLT